MGYTTRLEMLKEIGRIGKTMGNRSRGIVGGRQPNFSAAAASATTTATAAAATTTTTAVANANANANTELIVRSRRRARPRIRTSCTIGMPQNLSMVRTRTAQTTDWTAFRCFSSVEPAPDNAAGGDGENENQEAGDTGPVAEKLDQLVSEGSVQPDPHQLRAARELDRLYSDLMAAKAMESSERQGDGEGFFTQFFGQAFSATTDSDSANTGTNSGSRGIYTFGGVGCGKTFLMELFYRALDEDDAWGTDKQIVHYHKFMLNVHQFMHTSRQEQREAGIEDGNLIDPVVDHILESGKLLCLDEFQVTDVADAMILKELFGRLWKKGCILVTTSNRPPRDLYLHGLQRDRFLPFVDLLEERCNVVSLMDNETDYRMVISAQDDNCDDDDNEDDNESSAANASATSNATVIDDGQPRRRTAKRRAKQVYFCGKDQKKVLQKVFYERAKGRPSNPSTLETQGRKVKIPMACKAKSMCMFSFEDLCQKALGAADYLVIGQQFSTVFVYGIPTMTVNEINWLRRFITFVDSMYEWKVRLLLQTNAGSVEEIFRVDDKESYQQDEVFAFDRTRSRLGEMSSTKYLSSQWLGEGTTSTVTTKLDLEPSVADQWLQMVGGNLSQQSDEDEPHGDADGNMEEYYRKIFDGLDLNKDGFLDRDEIKTLMTKAFGYEPNDFVVNEMIASIDKNQDGVIDLKEFGALLTEIKQHR